MSNSYLAGYLLFAIVLSGLPTGYLLLVARWRLLILYVSRITGNLCENSSFEKIRTFTINFIQLQYFADVMNEFELIDWEVSQMNCDFSDLKQETIIRALKRDLLEFLVSNGLPGYLILSRRPFQKEGTWSPYS